MGQSMEQHDENIRKLQKNEIKFADKEIISIFAIPNEKNGISSYSGA